MKIAITCENNLVFQHFGHTPSFAVYTIEDNAVTAKELLSCGETGHGALAGLLKDWGVQVLICGGIGGGAQNALANADIKLVGGASGNVDEVIGAYLNGTLKTNADFHCHHHDHEFHDFVTLRSCGAHDCGGHHSCHEK